MTQLNLPKTIKVKVVRAFTYLGKVAAVGDELDLAYIFAREMLASGKVTSTEWPPGQPAPKEKKAKQEKAPETNEGSTP